MSSTTEGAEERAGALDLLAYVWEVTMEDAIGEVRKLHSERAAFDDGQLNAVLRSRLLHQRALALGFVRCSAEKANVRIPLVPDDLGGELFEPGAVR